MRSAPYEGTLTRPLLSIMHTHVSAWCFSTGQMPAWRIYRLHLSLTMANAVIDVVIASDTKNPDVIARMVEFGGGLSCAKIRYRPDPGTGLSESLM